MTLNPLACAVFLVVTFAAAGVLHVLWMASPISAHLASPLDGGRRFRGRRVFGDNKTWRGFAVMVPACAVAFLAFSVLRPALPSWLAQGVWNLPVPGYFALGLWAGLGFMAGELPNSFVKRQLGVAPGAAPARGWQRPFFACADRIDSILGMLVALAIVVPVPPLAWLYVLIVGPAIHALFSAGLYLVGAKARPA